MYQETMYQLFIYLQPGGDLIWLWQRRADGAVQQQGRADSLAQLMLPAHLRPDNAVLILPTEWVLLQQVELPRGAKASALPLLLEGQLFVDIDQQHWHDCSGKGRLRTVAMVDLQQLEQWRDSLLDQGLALCAVLPDCWLLPDNGGITLLQQGNRLLVRGPQQQGWALDTQLVDKLVAQLSGDKLSGDALSGNELSGDALPLACLGYGLDAEQQQRWRCSNTPLPGAAEKAVLGNAASGPAAGISWLTRRWRGEQGLLPGHWQQAPAAAQSHNWRLPMLLSVVLLVMLACWFWLDTQQQRQQYPLQQQQLTALLNSYPGLQAGAGLEEQLLDLRLAEQQRQQLALQLQRIAGVLKAVPGQQLTAMQLNKGQLNNGQLNNGQLQLSFKGLNRAQQQQLQQAVEGQQYRLRWLQPGRQAQLQAATVPERGDKGTAREVSNAE
ncbi:MAG: type II secretion system protein GspL [Marinobacterium sp.]|nr:type II secretion system protein GspL [Marinobacterium sp.]